VPNSPENCNDGGLGQRTPWHLDQVFIRIRGVQHYLWRAVD
jgi:putative transposase